MALLRALLGRFWPLFLAVALEGALLTAPKVTAVVVPPPPADLESLYASINNPVAVAVIPDGEGRGTRPKCGNPRFIFLFTSTGGRNQQSIRLPDLPAGVTCYEHKIVRSPAREDITALGGGGYPTPGPTGIPSRDMYFTFPGDPPNSESGTGPKIYRIALDVNALINSNVVRYLAPALFATLPNTCDRNQTVGLTFDRTFDTIAQKGKWNNNLLAACTKVGGFGGEVFSVDKFGFVTNVGHIFGGVSGDSSFGTPGPFDHPDVALTGLHAGDLFIPAPNAPNSCDSTGCTPPPPGRVLRLSPPTTEGSYGVVIHTAVFHAAVPSAKAVSFIANRLCNFGPTSTSRAATYFKTKFPDQPGPANRVDSIPKSSFGERNGNFAVISRDPNGTGNNGTGIWIVSQTGTVTPFSGSSATLLDAAFVDCFVTKHVDITIGGRGGPGPLTVNIHCRRGHCDVRDFDLQNSTLNTKDTNFPNNKPTGACTIGEEGDRNQKEQDHERLSVKRSDEEGGRGEPEEGEGNTARCPYNPPPGGANQFLVWKGNDLPGDGECGGG